MNEKELEKLSRRAFLRFLGSTGLLISVPGQGLSAVLDTKERGSRALFSPNAWLFIGQDNKITIFCSQCEIGQGVFTVLPAIVADELDADWKKVRIRQAPVSSEYEDPVWESQVTAGSASVHHFYSILRRAGAQARQMLVAAASGIWKVPQSECKTRKGRVIHVPSGRSLSYGSLARAASSISPVRDVVLKREDQFTLIGKGLPRVDASLKINGKARYGMDVRVEGMLYCVLKRPPAFGARPEDINLSGIASVSGVHSIFKVENKVAVVADSPFSAIEAAERLKVKWKGAADPNLDDKKIGRVLRSALKRKGRVHTNRGDVAKAQRESALIHETSYFLPYLAHATMEPMNCTAYVTGKRCRIWAPSQNQSAVLEAARKETGLSPHDIDIETTFMGGSFGRRFEVDFVREALKVAKRVKRPVKLFWTREDDFTNDFYRPANASFIRAGVNRDGRITFWQHKVAAPSVYWRIEPSLLEDGIDPSAVESIHNSAYSFPALHLEYVWLKELVPPLGFWRSVGNSHNCFTVESTIDELSYRLGIDPLEFRLRNLKSHPRAARVLSVAAEKAGWYKGPKKGQALGICQHFLVYTYIAVVAEVSVDARNGKIKVHRMVAAVDCGRAVNPLVVKQQIEGGLLFGLSAALKEQVSFSGGGVTTTGFSDYPILTMSETPEVEVHVVDSSNEPTGVGEVGTAPAAPSVANALFRASGLRVRTLPMTPSNIRSLFETRGKAQHGASGTGPKQGNV